MPKRLIPILSETEFEQLVDIRDHSTKPYLRERASAILKLADQSTVSEVAANGLLRKRARRTVSRWFHRFQADGIQGLKIKSGRGRKPAFSPSAKSI